jgi:hypothetical protein
LCNHEICRRKPNLLATANDIDLFTDAKFLKHASSLCQNPGPWHAAGQYYLQKRKGYDPSYQEDAALKQIPNGAFMRAECPGQERIYAPAKPVNRRDSDNRDYSPFNNEQRGSAQPSQRT